MVLYSAAPRSGPAPSRPPSFRPPWPAARPAARIRTPKAKQPSQRAVFPYERTPIHADSRTLAGRAGAALGAAARGARRGELDPGIAAAGRPPADLHELLTPSEAARRAAVAGNRHREGARELALPGALEAAVRVQRRRPSLIWQQMGTLRRARRGRAAAWYGRPLPARRQRARVGHSGQERHQEPEPGRVRQVRRGGRLALRERAQVLRLERAESGQLALAAGERRRAAVATDIPRPPQRGVRRDAAQRPRQRRPLRRRAAAVHALFSQHEQEAPP